MTHNIQDNRLDKKSIGELVQIVVIDTVRNNDDLMDEIADKAIEKIIDRFTKLDTSTSLSIPSISSNANQIKIDHNFGTTTISSEGIVRKYK